MEDINNSDEDSYDDDEDDDDDDDGGNDFNEKTDDFAAEPYSNKISRAEAEQTNKIQETQQPISVVVPPPRKLFHDIDTRRAGLDLLGSSFSEILDVPEDGCLVRTLFVGLKLSNNPAEKGFLPSDEIVGCVLAIGVKVPKSCGLKVGDEVIVIPRQGCKQCETCSSAGNWHFCDKSEPSYCAVVDLTNDNIDTEVLSGLYAVHDWRTLVRLPKEIPGHVGCMLSGSALRMYAAILEAKVYFEKSTRIRGFSNLLLICGNDNTNSSELHHFWCLYFLKNIFCDANIKVITASYFKSIVKLAPSLESDDAILLQDGKNMADAVTMQGCNKMDVVIDAVGSQDTFELALSCLNNGGLLTVVRSSTSNQTLQRLLKRSITIKAVGACSKSLLKEFLDILSVQGVWYSFNNHLKIVGGQEFCSSMESLVKDSGPNSNKCEKIVVQFNP